MSVTQTSARSAADAPGQRSGVQGKGLHEAAAADAGEEADELGELEAEEPGELDVFAEFADEVPATAGNAREEYLPRRGYVPVRQVFVQHHAGAPERPAILGAAVAAREFRPIVLYLLLLACEPLLAHNRRLPLRTVANMLTTADYPCSVRQARHAIAALERRKLVRTIERGTSVELTPLREDGSGEDWTPPTGEDDDPDLKSYMAVPHDIFSDDVLDQLHLPGLAVLLVALKETSAKSVFSVSVEKFADWYGFSERTAERGYRELDDAGLMRTHRQLVRDSRMPRGVRAIYHRTLLGAFNTQARRAAQRRAQAARTSNAARAGAL